MKVSKNLNEKYIFLFQQDWLFSACVFLQFHAKRFLRQKTKCLFCRTESMNIHMSGFLQEMPAMNQFTEQGRRIHLNVQL